MVRVIEVGPRDGLQNEKTPVPLQKKIEFVNLLVAAGVKEIEATSFVSPKWVPQLGDAAELWPQLPPGAEYSALVPNRVGLDRAVSVGVKRIAVFTAASDEFTKKNINMSIADSLTVFEEIVKEFRTQVPEGHVRGYVSTVFECPYSGRVSATDAANVAHRLIEMGVDEVSLGDTVGTAAPPEVKMLVQALDIPKHRVVWHFHDTHGTAVANVAEALEQGYAAFDSSAGGLGGCPYSPGAGGNLATEDLVYFLERSGVPTGIDLAKLAVASLPVLEALGRPPASKSQLAQLSRDSRNA